MQNGARMSHLRYAWTWLCIGLLAVGMLCLSDANAANEPAEDKTVSPETPQDAPPADDAPAEPASPSTVLDESVLLPLVMDFAQYQDPKIQKRALLQAQELKHPFLLPHIRYLARHGATEIRIAACETLAIYQSVEGLREIKDAAHSKDEELAIRAIELLAQFPLPVIREDLARIARGTSPDSNRRLAAIKSLQTMATPQAQAVLQELGEANDDTAQAAPSQEPIRLLLLRRLFTPEHLAGRLQAITQITEVFDSTQALGLLKTCLDDPDLSIRREALTAASGLNPRDLNALLSETQERLDTSLQTIWLQLLEKLAAPQAKPLLLTAISPRNNPSFRKAALRQLVQKQELLEDAETTKTLVQFFQQGTTDPLYGPLAKALSTRPDDRAFRALLSTLGKTNVPQAIRTLALDTLIQRAPLDLVDRLIQIAKDEPGLVLRKRAAAQLVLNHCEVLGDQCSEFDYHYPSDLAAGIFYTTAGTLGAGSLGMLSRVAGGNQPIIAALSGAVLGSGTAYLLTPEEGITMPEAIHFASMGIWGSALGYGLGATLTDGLDQPGFSWTFLGGQALGATLGALTYRDTTHTVTELSLMHMGWFEAASIATGALTLWGADNPTDRQRQTAPAIATLAGLGAGVLPMWFLANDLEFGRTDPGLIAFGALSSGALGSLAAYGTSDSDYSIAGGFLLGQGVGYLGALVASQHVDLTPGQISWLGVSTLMGSTFGGGLGSLSSKQEGSAALGAFIGGTAFTTLAAITTPYIDLSPADLDLGLYSGLVGSVLGISSAMMTDTDGLPNIMVGGSLGFMAGLGVDHMYPISLRDSSLGMTGALAGGALGTGLALIMREEPSSSVAGALIGAGTLTGFASLLWAAPELKFDDGDYLATLGAMAIGGFTGASLPGLIYGSDEQLQHTIGGSLMGTALGYGTGLAISQFSERDSKDIAEALWMTSLGGVFGQGLTAFTSSEAVSARRALTLSGTAVGLSAGLYFAEKTNYRTEDYWLISYLTAFGAFHGAWLPGLWTDTTTDENFSSLSTGTALIGTALGATSGILLSQYETLTFDDVNEMALGSIASSIFGAGVGLMVPVDDTEDMRPWVAGMHTAGILGTAAVGLLAPYTDFSDGDTTLGFLATAYGAWQGAGAGLLLDGTDRQVIGAILATTALGAAGGATISQYVDATTAELFAAFSGSVWGAWVGGMGSIALQSDFDIDLSDKEILGSFFIASDLGLIATALAMGPLMDMEPERIGWINLYGLSGMALGSALGAVFPDVPFWTSNVSGSALGLILGTVMTSFLEMPSLGQTPAEPIAVSEESGATASLQLHYPGQISAVLPQFQITPITTPDGTIVAEGNRFLIGVMGLWD